MKLTIGKCPFCNFIINLENATLCSNCQHKIYSAKWVANDGGETIVNYFKTLPEAKGSFLETRKTGKVKYYDYTDGVFRSAP